MKFLTSSAATLFLLAGAAYAADAPAPAPAPAKPVRIILVGDSTMANTSGYGDAFCARVNRANTCINLAKGGRSSGSFRAEGRWDEVEGLLRGAAAYRATYVLIQFGHNDQPGKPGRSTDLKTEFPVNMTRYAQEVKALGGVPVLVTPLTRRTFKDGVLENNLTPWADAPPPPRSTCRCWTSMRKATLRCRPWARTKPTRWRWCRVRPTTASRRPPARWKWQAPPSRHSTAPTSAPKVRPTSRAW
jgi:hypothetical protein